MPIGRSMTLGLKVYFNTIPFILLRILVTVLFAILVALAFWLGALVFFTDIFPENIWVRLVTVVGIPLYLIAVVRLVYRYLMFMIFCAHIAAMGAYARGFPKITFTSQIRYGVDIVKSKALSLSVLWVFRMVARAFFRTLTGLVRFLTSWIPIVSTIAKIVMAILDRFILVILDVVTVAVVLENYDAWMNARIGMAVVKKKWGSFLTIAIIFMILNYAVTLATFLGVAIVAGYFITGPLNPIPILLGVIAAAITYYAFLTPYIQAILVCEYIHHRKDIPEHEVIGEAYMIEREITGIIPVNLRRQLNEAISRLGPAPPPPPPPI